MAPYTPTYSDASRLHDRLDNFGRSLKGASFGGPQKIDNGTRQQGNVMNSLEWNADHPEYPDYVYPDDKQRDTYYKTKIHMATTMPRAQFPVTDDIVKYAIDKRNAGEMSRFKKFVEDSIPRGTPWARDFFEKIMPGWYQSKVDVIQDKLSIINKFIDITIRGPQNMDDMFILYELYTGRISLPQNWSELINGTTNQQVHAQAFHSGLFNPSRWVQNSYYVSKRNQNYMANFAIPGIDTKGLVQYGAGVYALPQTIAINSDGSEGNFYDNGVGVTTVGNVAQRADGDNYLNRSAFPITLGDMGGRLTAYAAGGI